MRKNEKRRQVRYFENNKCIHAIIDKARHAEINQVEREQEKRNMLKVDAQQRVKHSIF